MNWTLVATILYLVGWVIVFVMLWVVPAQRNPGSATAWLLFSFFLPYLALLAFLLIGSPKLPRARRDRQRDMDSLIAERVRQLEAMPDAPVQIIEVDDERKPVAALVQRLGGFPVFDGGVELLSVYAESIDRIVVDIDSATRYVHMLYYIFADDPSGKKVVDALCRAAERGVTCRVLYDALGNRPYIGKLADRLRAAGVRIRPALPIKIVGSGRLRPDLRNHRKITVVDGVVAYTGSQNIVEPEFKPGVVYEELVVRVTGPAVIELAAVFLTDWQSESGEQLPPEERPNVVEAIESHVPCQVLPSGPAYNTDNTALLFATLLYSARKRAVLTTPYFIPDESLLYAIENAALRGVDVRLIVSAQGDQFLVSRAQRSYYQEMLETGVRVFAVRAPALIHAKHISIDDDIALIGSSNFDVRSFVLNLEIVLLAYDRSVVAAQAAVIESYYARADEITLASWTQRPAGQQFVENTCRLVSALL